MEKRQWKTIRAFEEILFEAYNGIAKITINRPQYRNAFTPKTTWELSQAFAMCREMQDISVVLLTGAMSEVPEGKTLGDVKHAFCSGGDMHLHAGGIGRELVEIRVERTAADDVQCLDRERSELLEPREHLFVAKCEAVEDAPAYLGIAFWHVLVGVSAIVLYGLHHGCWIGE